MEYITAEQFLDQPKEVQKVFLDWWKVSENGKYFRGFIPYLTIGQLVKFIEYQCNKTLIIEVETCEDGKFIVAFCKYAQINKKRIKLISKFTIGKCKSLINAIWYVALAEANHEDFKYFIPNFEYLKNM